MNDKSSALFRRQMLICGAAFGIVCHSPSLAGDRVIYAQAPDWVEPAPMTYVDEEEDPSLLIYDWQHRLEGGTVTSYQDSAVRMDNPDMLAEYGTLSLSWLPDKGDLLVHRLQILRGDESIDLVQAGSGFEVIRREQGLEQRLLDGELTATLAVPGLKVGDILRVSYSTTLDDQALGTEMQVAQFLPAEPWEVGFSRARISWPAAEDVYWSAEDIAEVIPPELENGYRTIDITLPINRAPTMPADAPSRFSRPSILRVGTFADWRELSRVFAPHYIEAAKTSDDGAVAAEAMRIMEATSDPLERAALATRLVQDEISYLMDGMDGGNYMPQNAAETWMNKYGDCKAKSVLLFSILTHMGIEAVPALVSTSGGDALPELLPIPGNFDHMIVRATIDGTDYWLDGTSRATRLSNIGQVPPFFYALPLSIAGEDLAEMTQREQSWPDVVMDITTDYSAGIDLPALFDMTMTFYGPQSAQIEAMANMRNDDRLKAAAQAFSGSMGAGAAVSHVDVSYDDDAGKGTMSFRGVVPGSFSWKEGRLRMVSGNDEKLQFNPDRARPEWRAIPVQTYGPSRQRVETRLILPRDVSEFTLTGDPVIEEDVANTRVRSRTTASGREIVSKIEVIKSLGEIAAAQIGHEKREVRRINALESELLAPADAEWRWEQSPAILQKKIVPLLKAYEEAIAFADSDDYDPRIQRAHFLTQIYDWEGALSDLDILVEKNTSADMLNWRASVLDELGRTEAAIADSRRAYEFDPNSQNAFYLAELLAYGGQRDEAIDLLETVPVTDEESGLYANTYAIVMGLFGKITEAVAFLAQEVEEKPLDPSVLNADCWVRGLFDIEIEQAMASCTKAIERSENSAPMLDSRAMVSYRMGDYDGAIRDLDSALEVWPGQAASLYLRGLVKLKIRAAGAREDIDQALRISPQLKRRYAMHGVVDNE